MYKRAEGRTSVFSAFESVNARCASQAGKCGLTVDPRLFTDMAGNRR